MGKRLISFVVTVMLLLTLIPDVALTAYAANTYSINGVNVRYDNFSSSPGECWVYANNFYNKIWGSKFTNSFSDTNNSLRNLSDSELLLTADHLEKYVTNAALGSCIRITSSSYLHANKDSVGHSQIIVQKDSQGFTVFEGGLSASPYCREKYYTWSGYVSKWKDDNHKYIKYIKWPGAAAYTGVVYSTFDVNGYLDGDSRGDLSNYGTFDVWMNGTLVADNVIDYCGSWPGQGVGWNKSGIWNDRTVVGTK